MYRQVNDRSGQVPAQRRGGPPAPTPMAARAAYGVPLKDGALPDPTATERPIHLLILSQDQTFSTQIWNALVRVLGETETMRRYVFPQWLTRSGNQLISAIQHGAPRFDVVLIDVRASAGITELEQRHYEGFVPRSVSFEQTGGTLVEGILRSPPLVALVPNHAEIVRLNGEQVYEFLPQWEQYFTSWGYAGALVWPEDNERLHSTMQTVLEAPLVSRTSLPPPTHSERTAGGPAGGATTAPAPSRAPGATAEQRAVREPLAPHQPDESLDPREGLVDLTAAPGGRPRMEGVIAIWSPFDYVGRTTAALELAVGLQQAGYPTLLGEFRRPFGFLAQKLTLDDASFACSLLTLASQVNDQFLSGGPFVLPRAAVRTWLLRGLPLYDRRRQAEGPVLEFFHTGLTTRQEAYYELEVLQDPKQVMLRQLIEMLKEWPTFTVFVTGTPALDPVHFASLVKSDRLLIVLPLDVALFGVAAAAIQLLLRHIPKSAANIDLVFTRWDRLIQKTPWPEVARECYASGELPEEQHRKLLQELGVEREVHALLKTCGLDGIAAFLPDERPLAWRLARKMPVAPALLQEGFATDPYVLAVRRQFLPTYITLPAAAPANGTDKKRGILHRALEGTYGR